LRKRLIDVQMRKEKRKKKALNPETKVFKRSELLEKYIVKILFRWDNTKFKNLKKLKRSWMR